MRSFKENPDQNAAQAYVEARKYYWDFGRTSTPMKQAAVRHQPDRR